MSKYVESVRYKNVRCEGSLCMHALSEKMKFKFPMTMGMVVAIDKRYL